MNKNLTSEALARILRGLVVGGDTAQIRQDIEALAAFFNRSEEELPGVNPTLVRQALRKVIPPLVRVDRHAGPDLHKVLKNINPWSWNDERRTVLDIYEAMVANGRKPAEAAATLADWYDVSPATIKNELSKARSSKVESDE